MFLNERETRHNYVIEAAKQIMTAARTAPKGKGVDILEIITVTEKEIKLLSEELIKTSEETGMKFFLRDAENILHSEAIVLIGTHQQTQGLNCAYCGYATLCRKTSFCSMCNQLHRYRNSDRISLCRSNGFTH